MKGGKVVRWQVGKGERMVRQKVGMYMVLFRGARHKMSPRFPLFILMLIKGTKGWDGFKIFLRGRRNGKILLRSSASC